MQACKQEFFRAGEVLWNLGTSNKHFAKTSGKKVLQGNIFEFFAPIYSEKYVLNGKFNYQFSKNGRGSLTGFELTFQ